MKAAILILAVAFAVGSVVVINWFQNKNSVNMEKINLIASDNKKIAANLFKAENPKGWLLLAHMMPVAKESWNEFAREMQKFGYESIAIDLRGHGESQGGPDGYQKFSDVEHQASIKDLEAAWEFLKSASATSDKTSLIGASIGANLSLEFLAENPDIKKAVLLSPGLDYRGLKTESLIKKLKKDQSLVFATSKDDGNNAEENQKLYNLAPVVNKHLIIFEKGGHGTIMFLAKEELDLTGAILNFLERGSIN